MQLRFSCSSIDVQDPVAVLERSEYACSWCGFAAMYGMRTYVDDDGDRVACSVCHAVRHAGIDDRRYRIVWLPEMDQPQLSHLGRVIAFSRVLTESPSFRRTANVDASRPFVSPDLFAELVARGDAIDRLFQEKMDGSVRECLPTLPQDVIEVFLRGLRMLPVAFPVSEIDAWRNDESSLNAFGAKTLAQHQWFVSLMGLRSVGILSDEDAFRG